MGATESASLPRRHRLTAAEYHRMGEAGVFAVDARVELIEGEVIDMTPIGTRHHAAVMRLSRVLQHAADDSALVSVQGPLHLDDWSEPEPDLMLLAPREDFYAGAHPGPADVRLLIEVADTSARYDREIKLPLYARHGIGEVWLVDLEARMVRFFRHARQGQWTEITATETPGPTAVAALPGVTVDLTGVLG